MALLDVRAIFAVSTLLLAIMAGALWATITPRFRPGERPWIFALLLLAGAQLAILLRGSIPDAASILAGNLLMSLGFAMSYLAIAQLVDVPARPAWAWGVVAGHALLMALIWNLNSATRIALVNALFLAQTLLLAFTLLRSTQPHGGRVRKLMAFGYLLTSATFLMRTVGALLDPGQFFNAIQPGQLQAIALVFGVGGVILVGVSFPILNRDALNHEIRMLATIDVLTGIYNRRALIELGEKVVQVAARAHGPVSVLMLDLDNFKRINDTWGHQAGDRMLRDLVGVMRAHLRQQDVLGRYGGEEFCAVLPNTGSLGAQHLAERLRRAIEDSLFDIGRDSVPMTVSIGVASAEPAGREDTLDKLVNLSDAALYEAKNGGRNRIATAVTADRLPASGAAQASA